MTDTQATQDAFKDNVLEQALDWKQSGKRVVVASVIQTWGSAPCPMGSQLAVIDGGDFVGSVSGGCVEGSVIEDAFALMETGGHKVLDFGVSTEQAWEVGLACGGRIRILIDSALPLEALVAAGKAKRSVACITDLASGKTELIELADAGATAFGIDRAVVDECVRMDAPRILEIDGREIFINVHNPPLRLVIVGAVHIAQPLARMAQQANFAVTVVDPRAAFANEARFPDVTLFNAWPDEVLDQIDLDARSAMVTLTHDPKLDDPALESARNSPCFYIGALGSRKTQAARLNRLKRAGWSDEDLARIHGPVGLAIGSKSPPEIAVSILAEMIAVLRGAQS